MNFLVVIAVIFTIGSINASPTTIDDVDLAAKIKEVIDNILDVLPEKIGLMNKDIVIPENILLQGLVHIEDISLSGFKSPNIETVTYDDATSRLDYELNFEDVHLVVDYSLALKGIVEVNHHLSAVIDLSNLNGQGHAIISHDPKEVTELSILVSVEKIDADIKGLLNNDELSKQVSDELSENGAKIIDEVLVKIAPTINTVIKDIINLILKIVSQQ